LNPLGFMLRELPMKFSDSSKNRRFFEASPSSPFEAFSEVREHEDDRPQAS
jgi:hypothetical protein